ncbi:MAG: hypothetical protein NVSMB55_08720 [Mycobacteriales bacterium]
MSVSRTASGVAALALSGLGVFGLPSAALAAAPGCPAAYPPPAPAPAGGTEVKATGFAPCSVVHTAVDAGTASLGNLQADANGVVDAFVSLAGLSAGLHHITLSGVAASGAARKATVAVTVPAAAAPAPPAATGNGSNTGLSLPRTGAEIAGISTVGLVLVGGGGIAVYSGRRRRTIA